jgi:hypothetical protein
MSRLVRAADLPATDVSRQDFYDLVENAKPAADLVDGDTLEVSSDKLQVSRMVPRWRTFQILHTDLFTGGNGSTKTLIAAQTWGVVHAIVVHETENFEGGSVSAVTMSLGNGIDDDRFFAGINVKLGEGQHVFKTFEKDGNATIVNTPGTDQVRAYFSITGGAYEDLTQGSVEISVLYSEVK